jgi:hypothetical protein
MKSNFFVASMMTAIFFAAAVTSCNSKEEGDNNSLKEDIVATLKAHGGLGEFAEALNGVDFSTINSDELTVFAATDGVFGKSSKSSGETQCEAKIERHIVEGTFELKDSLRLTSLDGTPLLVTIIGGRTYINGLELVEEVPVGENVVYVVESAICTDVVSIPVEGSYIGTLTRSEYDEFVLPGGDSIKNVATRRITLELLEGKFIYTYNDALPSASGLGTYSIQYDKIIFRDERQNAEIWTLNGEYKYVFENKSVLRFSKFSDFVLYEYELVKVLSQY